MEIRRYSSSLFKLANPELFAATSNQVDPNYPLKFGDKLVLNIWGGTEVEETLVIDRSGNVLVSEVGRVSLNGLTLRRAQKLITEKLSISNPGIKFGMTQISLQVKELSSIKVYVLGNAAQPSAYVIQGNSSILNALYFAGGPNEVGSVRNIQLKRGRKKYIIDLYDYLFEGKMPKIHNLRDGDIIHIPAAEKLVRIEGSIQVPAIYELKKAETLNDLIKLAQGVKPEASKFYSIKRREGLSNFNQLDYGQLDLIISDQETLPLINGDGVLIKSNPKTLEKIVKISGEIHFETQVSYTPELKLIDVINQAGGLRRGANKDGIQVYRYNIDTSYTLKSEGNDLDIQMEPLDSIFIPSQADTALKFTVSIGGAIQNTTTVNYIRGMSAKTLFLKAGGASQEWLTGSITLQRMTKTTNVEIININISPENFLDSISNIQLKPFDRIHLVQDPGYYKPELVTLRGSAVLNPADYPLKYKGEKLLEFVNRVAQYSENIQWSAARLFRQRDSSSYPIYIDFEKALQSGSGSQIVLKHGDRIVLDETKHTVQVLGEIVSPGDVLWKPNFEYDDYIAHTGGYTRYGDQDRVLIIMANGAKVKAEDLERPITPGSQIIISYKTEEEPIGWSEIVQGTLSTMGAIASVILTVVIIDDKVN
jgi:protein involved in polysaccharide export with SLBB domain